MPDYKVKKDSSSGEWLVVDSFGYLVTDERDSHLPRAAQRYLYFPTESEARQNAVRIQSEREAAQRAEEDRISQAQRALRDERDQQHQREEARKTERQQAFLFDSRLHGLIAEKDSMSVEARKIGEEVNSLSGRLQAKQAALNAVEKCIADLQDLIDKHKTAKAAGETK